MENAIKICCVGDVMPGGVLNHKNSAVSFISEELLELMADCDLRLTTLECAIGNEPNFDPVKMQLKQDVIYAPDNNLAKLEAMGIDCVSLANNHAFDLGSEGLRNTIKQLDVLGIAHCGAGMDIDEASKPASFVINGKSIGVIAFCDYRDETVGYVPIATKTSAGMNSLKGDDYIRQIRECRAAFDYLIVMIHWGVEHSFWPTPEMYSVARKCIAAGADCIIGGHQHRVQPLTTLKGAPVFWGLGNFLFPPRYLRPPRPMYYPADDEDTSSYPVSDSYPWVTEPTYKIWKPLGRIGLVGFITIDNKRMTAETRLCKINDNHVIELCGNGVFTKAQNIEQRCVCSALRTPDYRVVFNVIRFFKRLSRIPNKILKR